MVTIDVDTKDGFAEALDRVELPSTRNFFVQFDADSALCDIDLDSAGIIKSLNTARSNTVRWLNFWSWDSTFDPAIEEIITRYGISPRLAGLIWPKPPKRHPTKKIAASPAKSRSDDLEKAIAVDLDSSEQVEPHVPVTDPLQAMGFTEVLNALWHFCSVDSDQHFRYVGYNQLYVVPGMQQHVDLDKPSGIRIWTSLILCDDGTVISVSEQPCKEIPNYSGTLQTIRQNSVNVFRHLSKLHVSSQSENSLHRVTIRPQVKNAAKIPSTGKAALSASDLSSVLFYYLFDDWERSFRLIAGFEHPYRKTLQRIRKEMFESPEVDLIHTLHQVGKQLNVLKLMYQSYELIIDRILYRQRMFDASLRRPSVLSRLTTAQSLTLAGSSGVDETGVRADLDFENISDTNVRLCATATVRFERLLDRVRLYALTEIENCLKEKEELVFMNFNLVALKESTAVEKLTRTTILLAKVTILFLPVSLMTGYFSVQVKGIENQYSPTVYWLSFLVVTILSICLVLAFEFASYKVAGRTVYKSLTKSLLDKVKRKTS